MGTDNRPIGILDSGFGGLSIFLAVRSQMPTEPILYFGDSKFAPYGKKDPSFIKERVEKIINFLIGQEAKLIVVACNTATVTGIDYYRQNFPSVPIVGVVPVLKTAGKMTKSNKIAILETTTTARSSYQTNLINKFAANCKVVSVACDDLVVKLENGDLEVAGKALENHLQKGNLKDVDVLVLGCTHFVFLRKFTQNSSWRVLDSGEAVARQVKRIIENNKIAGFGRESIFFTSGDEKAFAKIAGFLIKSEIKNCQRVGITNDSDKIHLS
ncbi:MAG: glutamate racemase [Candidatus Woykebacteria bacterium]